MYGRQYDKIHNAEVFATDAERTAERVFFQGAEARDSAPLHRVLEERGARSDGLLLELLLGDDGSVGGDSEDDVDWGTTQDDHQPPDLVRGGLCPRSKTNEHLLGMRLGLSAESGVLDDGDVGEGVRAHGELHDDPKVTTAAPDAPEEVGALGLAARNEFALGGADRRLHVT